MNASDDQATQKQPDNYIRGDEFEEKLFAAELALIRKQHPDIDKTKLIGLAFSGGGIRSATFSLGVMQALAEKRWLQKFHYLSTVSGGSYIGSSLTWLLHKAWNDGDQPELTFDAGNNFPYQRFNDQPKADSTTASDKRRLDQSKLLTRYLRQHGKYLTPGGGIGATSLLAVILRGMMLSLLVYIVPLVALMAMLVGAGSFPQESLFHTFALSDGLNLYLAFALVLFVGLAVVNVLYGFMSGLLSRLGKEKFNAYAARRAYDKWAGRSLIWIALLLLVGSLPVVAEMTHLFVDKLAASLTLAGFASAVFSILKSQKKDEGAIPLAVVAPLATALLVYGVLLLCYLTGVYLNEVYLASGDERWSVLGPVAVFVALSYALSRFVNINHISVHRYYRDRLMELFMPNAEKLFNREHIDRADLANEAKLSDMCRFTHDGVANIVGPYHLINANMVTLGSSYMKLSARGGDNFILSPLYCGNAVTGWRATRQYMGGNMSLATAMAISGAAADPHGAPGGEGLTRNWSISLLMALFNVRLGYWAVNPNPERNDCDFCFPNWFMQGWRELTGRGMDEKGRFVHLADGGHFENLALYELIRRRVKTIVVCDGAADPGYTFMDFSNFVEKIRVDFGVDVEIPPLYSMSPKPKYDAQGKLVNSYAVETAEQGYLKGKIHYDDGSTGTLIYIKTTMIDDLPKDVYGYKRGHPDFPDETTADQFFDEKQFEAYRELGYQIGLKVTGDDALEVCFQQL